MPKSRAAPCDKPDPCHDVKMRGVGTGLGSCKQVGLNQWLAFICLTSFGHPRRGCLRGHLSEGRSDSLCTRQRAPLAFSSLASHTDASAILYGLNLRVFRVRQSQPESTAKSVCYCLSRSKVFTPTTTTTSINSSTTSQLIDSMSEEEETAPMSCLLNFPAFTSICPAPAKCS